MIGVRRAGAAEDPALCPPSPSRTIVLDCLSKLPWSCKSSSRRRTLPKECSLFSKIRFARSTEPLRITPVPCRGSVTCLCPACCCAGSLLRSRTRPGPRPASNSESSDSRARRGTAAAAPTGAMPAPLACANCWRVSPAGAADAASSAAFARVTELSRTRLSERSSSCLCLSSNRSRSADRSRKADRPADTRDDTWDSFISDVDTLAAAALPRSVVVALGPGSIADAFSEVGAAIASLLGTSFPGPAPVSIRLSSEKRRWRVTDAC
mmetsp:Transcript_13846/g.34141  ORF Transcript_13846/g.34141 Transcript_13846/m.34141 type:complete len:266 (-) Transcript_13846:2033-2830(-)